MVNLTTTLATAGTAVLIADYLDRRLGIVHDVQLIRKLLRLQRESNALFTGDFGVADMWESTVAKFGSRTSVVFEGKNYSFKQMDENIVAVYMENRTEYIVTWLAVSKVGGISALINTNLRAKALLHCVNVSSAKILLFGHELTEGVDEVKETLLGNGIKLCSLSGPAVPFAEHIDATLDQQRATFDKSFRKGTKATDMWGFVYTRNSLPRWQSEVKHADGGMLAAVIKNLRFWSAGAGFATIYDITEKDRIYTALPLYHSAGGMIGVGMMFFTGATLVLRRKFSAKQFIPDIRENNCTVFQYIGELCRYLLAVEPSPLDGQHNVRVAIGNGLRPDIWERFQTRFNIPIIGEFYAATEGNASLFNKVDQSGVGRGAIGRMGFLMHETVLAAKGELCINSKAVPVRIVKFDVEKEEPVRGKDGFCTVCAPNEAGELLGQIMDTDPTRDYVGYYGNKEGTQKKVLTDVFQKGDKWFRTGDLLRRDELGFYYFVDRIGDTFRWKGENVSTNEVAEAISTFPGIQEANVYGVEIPGKDGRAGMAAVVMSPTTDLAGLGQHAAKNLPSYAVPVFLRALPQIEITGTFKHQKVALRNEGMNPSKLSDKLYMFNPQTKAYEPFGPAEYSQLIGGKSRL